MAEGYHGAVASHIAYLGSEERLQVGGRAVGAEGGGEGWQLLDVLAGIFDEVEEGKGTVAGSDNLVCLTGFGYNLQSGVQGVETA